jgi:hypothetical protein
VHFGGYVVLSLSLKRFLTSSSSTIRKVGYFPLGPLGPLGFFASGGLMDFFGTLVGAILTRYGWVLWCENWDVQNDYP